MAWEDIERAAAKMFNVWTSGGDLAFAKEAWGHLEAAGLTDDDGVAAATETYLRLIALCRIYEEFSGAKWDEDPDMPISFLAEDLDIDRFALGLLAGPHLQDGDWRYVEEFEMFKAALTAAVESFRPEVFECLRRAYGGDTCLYQRLCRTRSDSDEHDYEDFDITGPNMDAYDFVKHGCQR